ASQLHHFYLGRGAAGAVYTLTHPQLLSRAISVQQMKTRSNPIVKPCNRAGRVKTVSVEKNRVNSRVHRLPLKLSQRHIPRYDTHSGRVNQRGRSVAVSQTSDKLAVGHNPLIRRNSPAQITGDTQILLGNGTGPLGIRHLVIENILPQADYSRRQDQ